MLAKISLGINALLIVAVIILFTRTSAPKTETVSADDTVVPSVFATGDSVKAPVLAYINGDSLNAKYTFIKEKSAALEAKSKSADKRMQEEYAARQAEWDKNAAFIQNPNNSDEDKLIAQQAMMQIQAEMEEIEKRETEGLLKREQELQGELQKRIEDFLRTYSKDKGIDFVVNYQQGTQFILYGNGAYDITSDALPRLNALYEEEKKQQGK